MCVALARHNDLVRDAIESHDGFVFKTVGDAFGAAFVRATEDLGLRAKAQGEYEPARAYLEESLLLRRQLGNQFEVAASLNNLGLVAREQGDYKRTRADYQESLSIRRGLEDKARAQGQRMTMEEGVAYAMEP